MPQLLVLGEYEPEARTGPSIWLRCVVDRVLELPGLAGDTTPVVYLPDVRRQALGSAEACPSDLKPLVELQYRRTCWTQKNGRDWTVEAFLVSSDGGLRLDVSHRLLERLKARGRAVEMSTRWAAHPTVTATAKPAVSPVSEHFGGAALGADFRIVTAKVGCPLSTDRFRKLLDASGYQYLSADETGGPSPPTPLPRPLSREERGELPVAPGRSMATSTSSVIRCRRSSQRGLTSRSRCCSNASNLSLMPAGGRSVSSPTTAGSGFPVDSQRWTCRSTSPRAVGPVAPPSKATPLSRCRPLPGTGMPRNGSPSARVRQLLLHGNANQRPVLFGYAGCAVEGIAGVIVPVVATLVKGPTFVFLSGRRSPRGGNDTSNSLRSSRRAPPARRRR